VELAQAGGWAAPDAVQSGGAGWGLVWPGGCQWESWDGVGVGVGGTWCVGRRLLSPLLSGYEPNGLCRFGVKNTRWLLFSGKNRLGCGENHDKRKGSRKQKNSGEKWKYAGEGTMHH
jgi:hypothetical protein